MTRSDLIYSLSWGVWLDINYNLYFGINWLLIIITVPRLPVYCSNSGSCLPQCSSDSRTNQNSFFWVVLQQNLQGRKASCHTIHKKDLSHNQSNFRTFRRRNMCSRDPIGEEFRALLIKVTVPKEIKSNLRKNNIK